MKIGFLTAGGIAPCLSSSIACLVNEYKMRAVDVEFIGYLNGYKGLLMGKTVSIDNIDNIDELKKIGGSFLGNSRVKLTNIEDCVSNGYVAKGQIPLEVAAQQLIKDKIDILHTIGGDDTNTTAGDLIEFLNSKGYDLTVVGLPKTIDNDVFPIKQTLGAFTAADQTSLFFRNIVNENTTSSRQLIIHEVMGRNCGWLTAYSAYLYKKDLEKRMFFPELLVDKEKWDIHAIYIPEVDFDIDEECQRLNKVMDEYDCVNIFLSEGAGLNSIIDDMKKNNKEINYDAFGHVRLDEINPGQWFAKHYKKKLNADKVLVQKSGYFARSASPNDQDLNLISKTAKLAVECALNDKSCVVGMHEEHDEMTAINFSDIKGGKEFNPNQDWFKEIASYY